MLRTILRRAKKGAHFYRWGNIQSFTQTPGREDTHHCKIISKTLSRSPHVSGGHWNFVQSEILLRVKDKYFLLHKATSSLRIQMPWNHHQARGSSALHGAYCWHWMPLRKQKISSFSLSASWNWELFFLSDCKYTLKRTVRFIRRARSIWENCVVQSADLIVSKRGKQHASKIGKK